MKYLMVAVLFMSCTKQVARTGNIVEMPPAKPTYYITENGNGSNSGLTPNQAWNLEKANEFTFSPGDTINIIGSIQGTLTLTESGTHDAVITIRGGKIRSNDHDGLVLYNNDNIHINQVSLEGSGIFLSGQLNSGLVLRLDDKKRHGNIVLENITAKGYAYAGIRSLIKQAPDLAWESVEASMQYAGGYDSVIVRHAIADSNGYAGIDLAGLWPGRQNRNIQVIQSSASHNRGIKDMPKHSGHGIVLSNVSGGKIDSSLATNNGWEYGNGNVGIWAYSSENLVIQNSISFRNKSISGIDGDGFDLDGGTWNCKMQYNLSFENDGAGFLIYEYGDPNGMKNNTCSYNISFNDARKNQQYGGITLGGAAALHDISLLNNTIQQDKGSAITRIGQEVQGELVIKNNILSAPKAPYLFKDVANNYIGNAALNDKFKPLENSPVIDKGLELSSLPQRDFYDNQINGKRDIGAVEF